MSTPLCNPLIVITEQTDQSSPVWWRQQGHIRIQLSSGECCINGGQQSERQKEMIKRRLALGGGGWGLGGRFRMLLALLKRVMEGVMGPGWVAAAMKDGMSTILTRSECRWTHVGR